MGCGAQFGFVRQKSEPQAAGFENPGKQKGLSVNKSFRRAQNRDEKKGPHRNMRAFFMSASAISSAAAEWSSRRPVWAASADARKYPPPADRSAPAPCKAA